MHYNLVSLQRLNLRLVVHALDSPALIPLSTIIAMSEPVEEPVQATEVVEVAEATDAPETAALVDAETTKPESTESAEQTGEADKPAEEEKQGDSKSNVLKTTARHDRDHRKNNRFDPSSLPASDDPALMRQQVRLRPMIRLTVHGFCARS